MFRTGDHNLTMFVKLLNKHDVVFEGVVNDIYIKDWCKILKISFLKYLLQKGIV